MRFRAPCIHFWLISFCNTVISEVYDVFCVVCEILLAPKQHVDASYGDNHVTGKWKRICVANNRGAMVIVRSKNVL